jgi:hypothetical protein
MTTTTVRYTLTDDDWTADYVATVTTSAYGPGVIVTRVDTTSPTEPSSIGGFIFPTGAAPMMVMRCDPRDRDARPIPVTDPSRFGTLDGTVKACHAWAVAFTDAPNRQGVDR